MFAILLLLIALFIIGVGARGTCTYKMETDRENYNLSILGITCGACLALFSVYMIASGWSPLSSSSSV